MVETAINFVLNQFSEVLLVIITGVLTVASALAMVYIKKFFIKISANIDNDILNKTIGRLEVVTYGVVSSIEETTANALRKAVKEGLRKPEELQALGIEAFDKIIAELGEKSMEILDEGMGDVDEFVQDKIHEFLGRIKMENSMPEVFQAKKQ